MSKVAITKELLDDLADAVSAKTGESVPLTIEDMTDAIDGITLRSGTDLSASGATVTVPAGLYSEQQTKTVSSGSATTPATTITSNPSISVDASGLITATASASQSVSPTVSAGYVSSGTAGTITVSGSNTSQLTTQAAQTIHPSTSDQTIASGKYLTGTQTIKGVALSNLTAGNIKKDVVVKVGDSTDDDCVTSVTGTYEGDDSTLVVTLSWDSQEEMWTPDRTYSDIMSAYNANKDVLYEVDGDGSANGGYQETDTPNEYEVFYWVRTFDSTDVTIKEECYHYTANDLFISPSATYYDTSLDADATTSEVASGAIFYNGNGRQVGTATRRTSSDLTASGATVTAPSGYYASSASYTYPNAVLSKNSISVDSNGKVTCIIDRTRGYYSEGQSYFYENLDTQAATTITPTTSSQTAVAAGKYTTGAVTVAAMPSGTEGTPTATKGSVSNHSISVTPSVTNTAGYISGGTHSGTAVTVSASELVSGTYTVDSSGTKDVTNYASASVPSGTAGTPSATKGTVSNHSVSVTPSVTNTTGWITGSTKTGTAVTVTASELASGNKEITANGTNIDVVGYSTVSVNVSGGGGSGVSVATVQNSSATSSTLTFTNLAGEPTSFSVMVDGNITTGSPAKIAAVVYDGVDIHAQTITNTSNAQVSYADSGITYSYSNGTLIISSSSAEFPPQAECYLTYSYNGSAANIHTEDVQVGSGATSITFTGLDDEPIAWSCIFKSNFSTSNGYQRVIFVRDDGEVLEGFEMDSSAHPSSSHWTSSYSNGSLTITSQGTNAGGYFHQPGYYQLTYVIGDASPYQKINKTYYASTTAQSEKIEASTGYDAIGEVNVSIPAVSQTNLTAANIKSGTTVTISNGSTNLWSVTGTYSGGGSGGANFATETMTNSNNQATSIEFTLPSGRTPKAFFARLTSQIARNSSSRYYYVFDMRWDGSSTGGVAGNTFYMYNGTLTNVTSGYGYSQDGTAFTLTTTGSRSASPGSFYNGTYELVYVY